MGLRIKTNADSMTARRALGQNGEAQSKTLKRLSTGSRINSAADDAAGLAISEKLRGSIRGTNQAIRNANDGRSMIQVAEGGLHEAGSTLIRMRELAVQSGNDTLRDQERSFIDLEFQNLKDEIQRISRVTTFNGRRLLSGEDSTYDFQVGVDNNPEEDRISFSTKKLNISSDNLGISGLDIESKGGAQESLGIISTALDQVSGQRAELGARANRLESTVRNLEIRSEKLGDAKSRISDADFAHETAKNVGLRILNQASTASLAQANLQQGQNALKLLG